MKALNEMLKKWFHLMEVSNGDTDYAMLHLVKEYEDDADLFADAMEDAKIAVTAFEKRRERAKRLLSKRAEDNDSTIS